MPTTISANPNLALTAIQKFVPHFMDNMKSRPSKQIGYESVNSSLGTYKYQGESDFGAPIATHEGTGGPIDSFFTPFSKSLVGVKRMLGFSMSTEAAETDQYGIYGKISQKLATAHMQGEEFACANTLFNTGFTATTVSPDSIALYSSSGLSSGTGHTTIDSSTPFNNRGVKSGTTYVDVAFGYFGLELALQTFYDALTYRALPMPMMGKKKLVVPTTLAGVANRVVGSTKMAQSTDNDSNWAGGLVSDVIVNPYLTSTTAWFLIDENDNPLFKLNRRSFRVKTDEDIKLDTRTYMTTAIYTFGVWKAQGAWGTAGA